MKYIKLFEEHTANGPAEVKVGDKINVILTLGPGSDVIPNCEVLKILAPGKIVVNNKGTESLAEYDDSYDGYLFKNNETDDNEI